MDHDPINAPNGGPYNPLSNVLASTRLETGSLELLALAKTTSSGASNIETILRIRQCGWVAPHTVGNLMAITFLELKRSGANVWIGATDAGVLMRVHGVSPADVYLLISSVTERGGVYGPIEITQIQTSAKPLPGGGAEELPPGTRLQLKLTKGLLKILPTGSIIVSCCFNGYDEVLGPPESREETWKRAIEFRANWRNFMLFPPDSDDCHPWGGELPKGPSTPFER